MDGWMSSNNDNPFCFCICWWQGQKLAIKVKCKLKRNDGPNGMNLHISHPKYLANAYGNTMQR
jgi:hypothetical protein